MTEIVTDPKAQRLLFVVMAMAFFLDGLDGTIVTIALPEMAGDFGMSTGESSWIMTVYFMTMAGLILVFGKLADTGWIRTILVSGFGLFAVSSLACGLAPDVLWLLVFRAVQGTGAAMLAATGILLVVRFLPVERRHFGMSLSVLGASLGSAFGPVIGGLLTEHLSWSWIFFINVPVGIACVFLALRAVPSDAPSRSRRRFDIGGSVLLFIAMVSGLYVLESVPSEGPTSASIRILALFAISFVLFVLRELRVEDPVLDLSVFRLPRFVSATAVFLILNACFMGMLYLVPFLLNVEMGFDAVASGLLMLIQAMTTLAMCLPIGRMCDNRGTRAFAVAGCLSLMATFALFAFADAGAGIPLLVIALVALGAVWGFSGASVGPRMVENAPEEKSGTASALLSFFVYFGCAFGTAMFSALFNTGSQSPGTSIDALPPDAFMDGFTFVMMCGLAMSAVAAAISWILRDKVRRMRL